MTPSNPALQAFAAIPIAPNVAAYSIIPVLGNGPLETADDGVVSYKSAHIDGVASELVIRNAGHSVQADPRAVAEVRRILLLHLSEACPQGCAPTPSADSPSVVPSPAAKAQPVARVASQRHQRNGLPVN
jgi:hypothetical protein